MAEFECRNSDGWCTASNISVALVHGEFLVGGEKLISVLFPDFDPVTWTASEVSLKSLPSELAEANIDLSSELTAAESLLATKALAGYQAAELASATIDLNSASGVIAYCTPCGHTWIYEQ